MLKSKQCAPKGQKVHSPGQRPGEWMRGGGRPERAKVFLRRLLSLAALILLYVSALAQNNPYKINDELYRMYQKANARRYFADGVTLSTEMYNRALQLGDRKAQCIALITPVIYCQYRGDRKELDKAVAALQSISLKNGYLQYFYHASTLKVQFLLHKKESMEALEYTENMVEYARKHHHTYGIFNGFNNMGKIHYARMEFGMAINAFKQALEFGTQYLPDQDMTTIICRISECYEELMCYDDVLRYSLEGYPKAKSRMTMMHLLRNICVAAYMSGKYDLFRKYYAEMERRVGILHPDTRDASEIELLAMKAMSENRFEDADGFIASIPDSLFSRHKDLLWTELVRKYGDYKMVASRQERFYHHRIQIEDTVNNSYSNTMDVRLANMAIDYENQRLATEHQRLANQKRQADINNANLELANTRLTLSNSSLELSRTRSNSQIVRQQYQRKRLEAEKLRDQIRMSKARQHLGDTVVGSIVLLALIVLAAVALYMRSRNRLMAKLRNAHNELEKNNIILADALHRAETANRAKSVFIQNLGVEIRKPLDSLARTALMIAGANTTAEQLRQLNTTIRTDTDEMLGIVDNVLDRTRTES